MKNLAFPAPSVPVTRAGGLVDKPWYQALREAEKKINDLNAAFGDMTAVAVADLPSASSFPWARRFVTDANALTFHGVVAGGGTHSVPVYSDGSTWRIG